mmetsp:Transcript_25634/g.55706  ORF Transcript_25634/g.55706 Transcript_25634/m.55706 type:complete len:350 (-) Transcript_25634:1438-2487(-)
MAVSSSSLSESAAGSTSITSSTTLSVATSPVWAMLSSTKLIRSLAPGTCGASVSCSPSIASLSLISSSFDGSATAASDGASVSLFLELLSESCAWSKFNTSSVSTFEIGAGGGADTASSSCLVETVACLGGGKKAAGSVVPSNPSMGRTAFSLSSPKSDVEASAAEGGARGGPPSSSLFEESSSLACSFTASLPAIVSTACSSGVGSAWLSSVAGSVTDVSAPVSAAAATADVAASSCSSPSDLGTWPTVADLLADSETTCRSPVFTDGWASMVPPSLGCATSMISCCSPSPGPIEGNTSAFVVCSSSSTAVAAAPASTGAGPCAPISLTPLLLSLPSARSTIPASPSE